GSRRQAEQVASSETTISQAYVRLQNVLTDVAGKLNEGTGAGRGIVTVLDDIAREIQEVPGNFEQLSSLITKLRDAKTAADQFFVSLGQKTGMAQFGPWLEGVTGWDVSNAGNGPTDFGTVRPGDGR